MARILYIEDEPDIAELVRRWLEEDGLHEMVHATDGHTGLALAASERPDLILLDLNLGEFSIDGWETNRLLKADPATRSVPVIALTRTPRTLRASRAGTKGFAEYITKPFNYDELLEKSLGVSWKGREPREHGPEREVAEVSTVGGEGDVRGPGLGNAVPTAIHRPAASRTSCRVQYAGRHDVAPRRKGPEMPAGGPSPGRDQEAWANPGRRHPGGRSSRKRRGRRAKAVNHDFRNHLTVILGNADDLRRIASKFFLEDYLDEINQLRDLGHQALELVDGTATQLRSADGCSAVDEVQGYLNRVRVEGATGLEFPTAPALVTGRILVAEDHEGIREQICGFLREQKHFVEEASNGREALEAPNAVLRPGAYRHRDARGRRLRRDRTAQE